MKDFIMSKESHRKTSTIHILLKTKEYLDILERKNNYPVMRSYMSCAFKLQIIIE